MNSENRWHVTLKVVYRDGTEKVGKYAGSGRTRIEAENSAMTDCWDHDDDHAIERVVVLVSERVPVNGRVPFSTLEVLAGESA